MQKKLKKNIKSTLSHEEHVKSAHGMKELHSKST